MATPVRRVTRRGRRALALGLAAVLLLALSGCRYHVDFTIREDPNGSVTFRLLSGSGRFVVVEATGPGATVPGEGWWRVDRDDGSADALPTAATRISADGARILLTDGSLWDEGAVSTAPGVYSDDLTSRAFLSGGVVRSEDLATGAVVDVEAAYPRPAGTTSVTPESISDDGQTVQYRLDGAPGGTRRVVRLGDPTPLDLFLPGTALRVAAGGTALARITLTTLPSIGVLTGATVELVAIPSGSVLATWSATYTPTTTTHTTIGRVLISEDGTRVWIHEAHMAQDGARCAWVTPTIPATCAVDNTLTSLAAGHTRAHPVGYGTLVGLDITPDGLLAVTDKHSPIPGGTAGFAPEILQAVHGDWETLGQGPDTPGSHSDCLLFTGRPPPCTLKLVGQGTQISDDGLVLASRTMTGRGWYDYVDPPDPPA